MSCVLSGGGVIPIMLTKEVILFDAALIGRKGAFTEHHLHRQKRRHDDDSDDDTFFDRTGHVEKKREVSLITCVTSLCPCTCTMALPRLRRSYSALLCSPFGQA